MQRLGFHGGAACLRRADVFRYSVVPDDPKISPLAVRAVIIVLVTIALVALFANIQRARRNRIETVIVAPIATPSPSASPR